MKTKLGHTMITCRHCGQIHALENEVLETMRQYSCPRCSTKMTDYELCNLKLHYYVLMGSMYAASFGSVKQYMKFDYDIDISPKNHPEEGGDT